MEDLARLTKNNKCTVPSDCQLETTIMLVVESGGFLQTEITQTINEIKAWLNNYIHIKI